MSSDFESGVFGKEKDGSFESAAAQISKGFGEEDFYPALKEKSATVLYLIVKNHGFAVGNKRIAVACFLLFLQPTDLLHHNDRNSIISNDALASLRLSKKTDLNEISDESISDIENKINNRPFRKVNY
jgi:prophage maintenance system killer protein